MRITPPNYTQTPNDLFDHWLPHLREAELKVLMVVIRKTFGWHKGEDRISLSQLQNATGLERRHVSNAVKSLQKKKLLYKEVLGKNGFQETHYSLNVIEDSNKFTQCRNDTPPSVFKTPTKEITKEIKKTTASPTPSKVQKKTAAAFSIPEELKKSKLTKEEVEIAITYYEANKQAMKKLKNPVGWLINGIKDGWLKGYSSNQEIIEKRRRWAKNNEYSVAGGYQQEGKEGLIRFIGGKEQLIKYDSNHSFWDHAGLPIE